MENNPQNIKDLLQRIEKLEASRSADVDAAKVLLSGALPRQRIHWSQEITHADRFAVAGVIAVWTLFLHSGTSEWTVAWASAISSLLVGLWRLNVRSIDAEIAQLYPAIAHYEKALGINPNLSTIREIRQQQDDTALIRTRVDNRTVGNRGHLSFDGVALTFTLAMAFATWRYASHGGLYCFDFEAPFHPLALLIFNLAGASMVLRAMNCFQTNKGGIFGLLKTRQ